MTEYQISYWRDLPSLVVARDGDDVSKSMLAARLQAGIDEAAMRLGDVGSESYLAGWRREDWTPAEGSPSEVADRVAASLEQQWPPPDIAAYLDSLTPEEQS